MKDAYLRGGGPSGRAGWRRVAAGPEQGLRDDRGPVVDGQRRRAVQLVPEVQGLADAVAERCVVRAGEYAVAGQPVGRHAGESRAPETRRIWPVASIGIRAGDRGEIIGGVVLAGVGIAIAAGVI